MRATIDGDSYSVSATRVEGLALRLMRYLQNYSPADRGQQVLIYVEHDELFEGFDDKTRHWTQEETLAAMKLLADTVNDLYFDEIEGIVPFDSENNISLPDPKEVRLEVVMKGQWRTESGLVDPEPVFQILTKKWVGPIPFESDYVNSLCCIPVL